MNNVVSLNKREKRLYTANDIAEMFSVAVQRLIVGRTNKGKDSTFNIK